MSEAGDDRMSSSFFCSARFSASPASIHRYPPRLGQQIGQGAPLGGGGRGQKCACEEEQGSDVVIQI